MRIEEEYGVTVVEAAAMLKEVQFRTLASVRVKVDVPVALVKVPQVTVLP